MEFTIVVTVSDEDANEPKSDPKSVLGSLMTRIADLDFMVDGDTLYVDDVTPEE